MVKPLFLKKIDIKHKIILLMADGPPVNIF